MSGGLEHIKQLCQPGTRVGSPTLPQNSPHCRGVTNSPCTLVWPPCSLIDRLTAFYHYDQQGL